MAEERPDREDRTEAPTPQRAEKARERGQVARSRDLVSALTLMAGVAALDLGGSALTAALAALSRVSLSGLALLSPAAGGTLASAAVVDRLTPALQALALALWPFFALILVVAVLGVVLQTGVPQASWLTLDLSRLDPLARLRQLFSAGHGGWELGKVTLKLLLIGGAALHQLLPLWRELAGGALSPPGPLAARLLSLCSGLLYRLGGLMLLLGALDYLWARRRTAGELRMTKQEVRDELRQNEGDPQVKRALRRRARDLQRRRVAVEVPKADVVVVNPTHYAVALRYRAEQMQAPRVTAKGVDELALRMRALARSAGVPVVASPRLARDLHRRVPVGREVPGELYRAVAEVLAFVYRLRRPAARPQGQGAPALAGGER